ncbi:nuclease [Phenylobacterium sp.]|uniref:nuclease n=1 Tax=Phenylobacterium sp. TaxID=1871053 RepID=UPI00260A0E08|nr:nuclease [Phenylobacterium sp.]
MALPPVLAAAVFLCVIAASPAAADPCEAPLPRNGEVFAGQVRYVGDGDGLCVGPSSDPATWIEVRVADFYAPELNEPGGREAKVTLERIAKGRPAKCIAGHRSWDRVVAVCEIGGRSVGDMMRAAGVSEGGRGR